MQCQLCKNKQYLVCTACCLFKQNQLKLFQNNNKVLQQQYCKNVQQKLQAINQNYMIKQNERLKKINKIRKIKQNIVRIKGDIEQEKNKMRQFNKIQQQFQQKITQTIQMPQQLQRTTQIIQNLHLKNTLLKTKILQRQKQKTLQIQTILKVYNMDKKKYKIQKYFRFQETHPLIFTLQNLQNQSNSSIPVLRANNQQIIKYYPLQKNQMIKQRQEEQILVNILKISNKLTISTHRIYAPEITLPYKMYFSKQFLYTGNNLVRFDSSLQLQSQNLIIAINMLQANIQYLCYALGLSQKSFLVLDHNFYQEINQRKYELVGFDGQHRKWKSFLKYLKISQILNSYEEDYGTGLLILRSDIKSDEMSMDQKSQKDSDQQFQVLQ